MAFLLFGGIIFYFIYSPALNIPFAYHDHLRFFGGDFHEPVDSSNDYEYKFVRSAGGPIAAEIEFNTFRNVGVIKDVTFFRYVTVFLIVISAVVIAVWLNHLGLARDVAFLMSASLFTLPGVQTFVCMASIANVLTIFLAVSSSLILYRLKAVSIRNFARGDLVNVVLSLLLLMAGLFTYPTIAYLFLLPPLTLILFGKLENWPETRRVAVQHLILLGVASLLYFIAVKNLFSPSLTDVPSSYNVGFTTDVVGKLRWFTMQVSVWALNLWNIYLRNEVALAVALLICLGVLAKILTFLASDYFRCNRNRAVANGFQAIGAVLVLVVAVNAPLLVMSGGLLLFRVILPYTVVIAVILFFALKGLAEVLTGRFARSVTTAIFCVVFTGSAVYANFNITSNALNLYSENLFLSSQLAGHTKEDIKRIHIVTPLLNGKRHKYGYNGRPQLTGEFNVGSLTHQTWVTENVRAALLQVMDRNDFILINGGKGENINERLKNAHPESIIVTYSELGEAVQMTPNTVIIDMNNLMRVSFERNRVIEDSVTLAGDSAPPKYGVANAFDYNPNTFWETSGPFPHWIQRDFGDDSRNIRAYALQTGPATHPARDSSGRMPRDWQFQGSNDGKKWKVLDIQKNQSDWKAGEKRAFSCPNLDSFRYYRLYITAGVDSKILRLYEVEITE